MALYLYLHSVGFTEFVVLKGKSSSFLLSNYASYFDPNRSVIVWVIVFSSFMAFHSLRKESADLRAAMVYCGSYLARAIIRSSLCWCINHSKVFLLYVLAAEGPIYRVRRQIRVIEVTNLEFYDVDGNKLDNIMLAIPDNKLIMLWLFRFLWDLVSLVIFLILRYYYKKENKDTKNRDVEITRGRDAVNKEDTEAARRKFMRKRRMALIDGYFIISFFTGILRAANLHRNFIFF